MPCGWLRSRSVIRRAASRLDGSFTAGANVMVGPTTTTGRPVLLGQIGSRHGFQRLARSRVRAAHFLRQILGLITALATAADVFAGTKAPTLAQREAIRTAC